MSEKLCLQSNNFNENVTSAFVRLRDGKEFADVTLACEDGQQMEAHKIILASLSPVLGKILQKNKHPHPLIYFKGFHSQDLASILDFLYVGEANVYQENLDSFLAVAEELKVKGLAGQSSGDLSEKEEKPATPKIVEQNRESFMRNTTCRDNVSNDKVPDTKAEEKIWLLFQKPKKMSASCLIAGPDTSYILPPSLSD